MKFKSILFSMLLVSLSLVFSSSAFSQLSCYGNALSFDGSGQTLKLAPNEVSSNNFLSKLDSDYTIECLIYWRGNDNGNADFQRIFDFHYGQQAFIFLTPSEGGNHVPRFAISTTALTSPQVLDANKILIPNVYHHIAVTYSRANNMATLYIDGENVNSGTITIAADSVFKGNAGDVHDSSENELRVSPYGDAGLNANLDEFRVSDTIRYTDNFTPSSIPFVTDAHTLALYHFNEGTGQMAGDSSGNENTAVLGATMEAGADDPTWISCSGVLATSILNLSATSVQNHVQLSWAAASNSNIKSFEIQRSSDAKHFSALSTQNSATTTGTHTYSYTDATPLSGDNYYRVKELDASGSSSYSSLAHINLGNSSFRIYPTVASHMLHISVSKTPSSIVVYSANGKPVKTFTASSGEQDIDISSLPVGSYFVRNTTTNTSLKFVKQ